MIATKAFSLLQWHEAWQFGTTTANWPRVRCCPRAELESPGRKLSQWVKRSSQLLSIATVIVPPSHYPSTMVSESKWSSCTGQHSRLPGSCKAYCQLPRHQHHR